MAVGRPKAVWVARIHSIGRALIQGEGIRTHIRITLEREPNRDISIHLTQADAIKWRDALTVFIEKTEKGE
jgi:hypothetical protein